MTTVQWLTLIVFFITIAAIVVNKLDATTWPAAEFFDFNMR